jgi:hypothetical protein
MCGCRLSAHFRKLAAEQRHGRALASIIDQRWRLDGLATIARPFNQMRRRQMTERQRSAIDPAECKIIIDAWMLDQPKP